MWLPDRRAFLLSALAVAGCGFTPVYGPAGGGSALLGRIALAEPETTNAYAFNRRFEERLGRATAASYLLETRLETESSGLGSLADGRTTRYRIVGRAFYTLREQGRDAAVLEGRTNAFTGYSATGSTAATEAAARDARERLMILLADQVIDRLILDADQLVQGG